jgi:hypothetical protein
MTITSSNAPSESRTVPTSGLILSLPIPGISAAYPVEPLSADGGCTTPPRQLSANHRRGRMP